MKKILFTFLAIFLFIGKVFAGGTLFIDDEAGVHVMVKIRNHLPLSLPYVLKAARSPASCAINVPSGPKEDDKNFQLGITYVSRYMRNENNKARELWENFQTFNIDPLATYVVSFKRVQKKIEMRLLPL
jgi:hypothetical protein